MSEKKIMIQKIWGILLLIAGIGMFFAIPGKARAIQAAGNYSAGQVIFLQISLYIMSFILVLGGGKKLYDHCRFKKNNQKDLKPK